MMERGIQLNSEKTSDPPTVAYLRLLGRAEGGGGKRSPFSISSSIENKLALTRMPLWCALRDLTK